MIVWNPTPHTPNPRRVPLHISLLLTTIPLQCFIINHNQINMNLCFLVSFALFFHCCFVSLVTFVIVKHLFFTYTFFSIYIRKVTALYSSSLYHPKSGNFVNSGLTTSIYMYPLALFALFFCRSYSSLCCQIHEFNLLVCISNVFLKSRHQADLNT